MGAAIAPRIRTGHELPSHYATPLRLHRYPERLLLAGPREAEPFRRDPHGDARGLDHGDGVPCLARADVGDRPVHGHRAVEAVHGHRGVVQLVRRRRARRARERGVELGAGAGAGAREQQVVLVRRVVHQARVQRVLGPDVARAVVHGPRHRAVPVH